MQVNISGHHVEMTESTKTHIKNKVDKIASHYPGLISMSVILSNERNANTIEMNTSYEGAPISATGSDENLYAAISITCKKMDAALSHRKGVLKAKQHNKPVLEEPEAELADDEEIEADYDYEEEEMSTS
jgi:putative sigma-54 modulation protein